MHLQAGIVNTMSRYKVPLFLLCLVGVFYLNSQHARNVSQSIQTALLTTLDRRMDNTAWVEQHFSTMAQDDPRLISYARTRYLIPPSAINQPYHFDHPGNNIKTDHGQWVRKYLKDMRNGVFIEAGANEGEFHSHTLELEMELGWTGLLIECNPTVTPYLRTKQRKAWVAGVCISTTEYPAVFNFSNPKDWTYSGRIGAAWDLPVKTNWTYFDVESVPLYTIIAAAGYDTIDFFSFDVEGVEFNILKNFPFDKVTIKLMIMEVQFIDQKTRDELEQFLNSKGFTAVEKQALDHIYAHHSLKL